MVQNIAGCDNIKFLTTFDGKLSRKANFVVMNSIQKKSNHLAFTNIVYAVDSTIRRVVRQFQSGDTDLSDKSSSCRPSAATSQQKRRLFEQLFNAIGR